MPPRARKTPPVKLDLACGQNKQEGFTGIDIAGNYDIKHDLLAVPWPIKPGTKAEHRATCGHCGLSWDDGKSTAWTPAPSARCPFESFHVYQED